CWRRPGCSRRFHCFLPTTQSAPTRAPDTDLVPEEFGTNSERGAAVTFQRKAVVVASMIGALGVGGVVGAVALAPTASGAATSTTVATSTDNPVGNGTAPSDANPNSSGTARAPDGDCPHG